MKTFLSVCISSMKMYFKLFSTYFKRHLKVSEITLYVFLISPGFEKITEFNDFLKKTTRSLSQATIFVYKHFVINFDPKSTPECERRLYYMGTKVKSS